MKIEERKMGGFDIKLVVLGNMVLGIPSEIGPRILYLASSSKPEFNLFGILPDAGMQTPNGFWRIYGGHRLWSSPESWPRSYSIDDKPVRIQINEGSVSIHGNSEFENSIQKEMIIEEFSEDSLRVTHIIKNVGRWPIRLACWALSVMRQNGFAVIPIESSKLDERGLLPDRHISLWPYDDLSDKRVKFSDGYAFINQSSAIEKPFKIGTMASPTWTAYYLDGMTFVKMSSREEGEYPDFGCSVEVYINAEMLELETVGPLRLVNPSDSIQHMEIWKVIKTGELSQDQDSIEKNLKVWLNE